MPSEQSLKRPALQTTVSLYRVQSPIGDCGLKDLRGLYYYGIRAVLRRGLVLKDSVAFNQLELQMICAEKETLKIPCPAILKDSLLHCLAV